MGKIRFLTFIWLLLFLCVPAGCKNADSPEVVSSTTSQVSKPAWPESGFFEDVPDFGQTPDDYTEYENHVFSYSVVSFEKTDYESFLNYCSALSDAGFKARSESDAIADDASSNAQNTVTYHSVENNGIWIQVTWSREPESAYQCQVFAYDQDPLEQKQAA